MATPAEIEAGAKAMRHARGYSQESWEPVREDWKALYREDARLVLEAAEAVRPAVDRAAVGQLRQQVIDVRYAADAVLEASIALGRRLNRPAASAKNESECREVLDSAWARFEALLALIAPETGATK